MPQREEYPRRRRRSRRRKNNTTGAALLLFAAILLLGSVIFFRIRTVEVQGNVVYTAQEVIDASEVRLGKNLVFSSADRVEETLRRALPYANEIHVTKKLPGTILITISERRPVACIQASGAWWLLDSDCRVLERTNAVNCKGLAHITGLSVLRPEEGSTLRCSEEDMVTGETLGTILTVLTQEGLLSGVEEIQAENFSNLGFTYDGRLQVTLGTRLELETKVRLFAGVLQKLEPDAAGTVDVSRGDEARFVPN